MLPARAAIYKFYLYRQIFLFLVSHEVSLDTRAIFISFVGFDGERFVRQNWEIPNCCCFEDEANKHEKNSSPVSSLHAL